MADSDQHRLEFVLSGQQHCDHFLTPIADPRGKSVLVVGVGAGTEMLWCLRHGAREVVGIDILEQSPTALLAAARELGLDVEGRFRFLRMPIEKVESLDRRFDLVLSNNVFEHLLDLEGALAACAGLVEPDRGRIAIFTDPLFYSSSGSHLTHQPWEHIWGDAESVREKVLSSGPPDHSLRSMSLDQYLFNEITLNRMRLGDLIDAVSKSGLTILNIKLVRDRNLNRLTEYRSKMAKVSATDLGIEGIGLELARLEASTSDDGPMYSTEEGVLAQRFAELDARIRDLERTIADREALICSVEASVSFRLGRRLTAPFRWLRERNK
jgi:hypothetical protein